MAIPVIEAEGSNYDIGLTIGQALRRQVQSLIGIKDKDYQEKTGKDISFFDAKIKPVIKMVERYFPGYFEELKGLAEGSSTDINTVFMLGCEDGLVYNCTSVACLSRSGVVMGHNEDWLRDHAEGLYICRLKQRNKPSSISLSYAGYLPGFSTGLNSKGCAYTENALHLKDCNHRGVPIQFFTRAFLDAKRPSDLIRLASMGNKMAGWNSLVAFGNRIFDMEITTKSYAIIEGDRHLAHTNHLLNRKILSQEECHSRDSVWRLERANELLGGGEYNFGLVRKILSDHKHRPFSICCHEFEKKGEEPYATLASVIMNVNSGEFHVAHGNPCKSAYRSFEIQ